ncbi:hypothetical protein JWG39_01810 [Desulforhopalus vacuolatus]|uniref:glycoside hydrolase family 3 protein n=1 Tax=Desulforhopalus vacuolatus TaxID=40414 RepID=UPI0019667608|nr:glycoside hydrolase family 3 N-terminal domain-containing protein [Desulforhopalus vacuolatus]MBM9518550.1 hypothetical protein [Desulforhopalus vacuolatus]
MTNLKEKIGQLFLLGFPGTVPTPSILRDIRELNLGGVILFDKNLAAREPENNIRSAEQVRRLTDTLQKAAAAAGTAPLFIAVDQEGGQVSRFRKERGFKETPSAARLGEAGTAAIRTAAGQTARLLNSLGINVNFAPVADVNVFKENPIIGRIERSFSADPEKVTKCCSAWIEEHRKQGVLTSLKHFPGHGSSRLDSHLGFVDITETWREEELIPFHRLVQTDTVDLIMVGHLCHRQYDATLPATLSPEILHRLLRERCGWNGVAVSDDMQMKSITKKWGLVDACCRSIAAGLDLLIIGNNLNFQPEILKEIEDEMAKRAGSNADLCSRIEEAWLRVIHLKKSLPRSQPSSLLQ